ncbi:cilia- and flagella-associated protein 74 isoform X2 [Bos indicus x Bos taurus]|uniref:cilia- and flagella-associated protein 74 isoform X2 n=1 Tax=Bos indicus x Bos taurus TaxID=30522 RepID=UPI000F7D15CD|nr:cilia- and flagella-associated protein 74 isoform X2 [Bos indicus x Bos taurus]
MEEDDKKLLDDKPLVEDDTEELEDPELVLDCVPREAEQKAGLGSSCPGIEQSKDKQKQRLTAQEKRQACLLRRDLSHLDQLHEEKDLFIQKTRGELRACRRRMELLVKQQESVAAEIAAERAANNMAAMGRLEAASRRLCSELKNEQDLQAQMMAVLQQSQSALWQIEVQEGQLEDARKSAQEEAAAARRGLQERAAKQLHREMGASGKAERNRLLRARRCVHLQKELGLRQQKLVEEAQKNHRKALRFLKASLGRIREQEQKEELETREHMRRRMDAVLALKNSISANRETLRKFQAWGQAKTELAEQKAQAEKKAILAQGGDAFKHLCHQRRRQELEAQNRAFEEEQKRRKQEIVSRLLKEEAVEDRRRPRPEPPRPAGQRSLRDQTWSYVATICDGQSTEAPLCCPLPDVPGQRPGPAQEQIKLQETRSRFYQSSPLLTAISSESVQGDGSLGGEDTLAWPEIPGLWKEDYKPFQVSKEDVDRKPVGGTKMDKDILARTMQRLRSGVIHKQVASGREFRGCPFNSKPKFIHFKDFDVGKVYKKKITLINATYTINYCKLVGVDESLQDFIHVDFDPPGPLSAGMSCEVLVTFKPMINKDLEGNVSFLAQTGGFSVPLKCSTKKCSLSLDKELIDFGSYTVGETAIRTITLTNTGGLGTKFRFLLASETCEMDTSQSVLKLSSTFTYEDKSLYDKFTTSFSEHQMEGNESSPTDVPSQKESGKLDVKEQEEGHPIESEGVTLTTIMTIPLNEEQMEFSLGETTEGDIGPFSSIKVPVIFTPIVPGTVQNSFKVVFKNQQCPTLYFKVVGVAIDVPVWVPKPNVDLKICMYDRLYQDSILVHTRSKAALRLKFEVCKELRGHVELLPETGYIQALSSYSVQLKFLPRHSLPEDAGKYFDKETRVLEAPMTIRVADQIKPVGFTVHAVVTTSDLELSPAGLDFGYCTIYEAIRTQISLCNHSLLPQEFGFVGLPKFVDIQPNDGFGTILPLETLQLDVIFQPTKAKEYNFELICKSEINRCFKLACRAVGVYPPLELSHNQIKFAATSLYDTSVATLYVINSHLSMNSLTHSVPRIGSEDAFPVGPTSFEFLLPPDSPITISPLVGTVWPGKRCLVRVAFRPVLPSELIHQEAFQALSRKAEVKLSQKETVTQRKDQRRPSFSMLRLQNQDRLLRASASQPPELQKEDLASSSQEYQSAQASLTRSFQGKFDKFVVPCVVASGDTKDRKGTEPLSFSPHNTLYLELWCPAVAPSIVVTSDKGKTIINFGDIAAGHRGIKKVSIQNISPEDLDLEYSVLNPDGPFVLLNPTIRLPSGETQVLDLSFSPRESVVAREILDIITKKGTLSLALMGTGVASTITCSIEGDVLNMGYVIARESVSLGFKLQNNSPLPIKFSMQLDSLSSRSRDQHRLPQFLASPDQRTEVVGTQNYSGQSVFSVVPVEGVMEPGKAQDFTVTFSPDHESLYFSDRLQVVLFEKAGLRPSLDPSSPPACPLVQALWLPERPHIGAWCLGGLHIRLGVIRWRDQCLGSHRPTSQPRPLPEPHMQGCKPLCSCPQKVSHHILLKGAAREHMMFVEGGDPLDVPVESLTVIPAFDLEHREEAEELKPILVTLDYAQLDPDTKAPPATRELQVGCIRTTQLSAKKPDHPLLASALLQLRGDVKETYKVLFVAQVVTGP